MIALLLALVLPAQAYEQDEHELIARESYEQACHRLSASWSPWRGGEGSHARLAQVCGHLHTRAEIFGQVAALAGDYAEDPDELRTAEGRRRLHSLPHFLLLALGNDAHFHPEAPRVWSRWHREALFQAVAASRAQGLDQAELLDDALATAAFAAHFLHDAHASGHMGIDRAASSAGAAHSFHDHWNRKGRTVRDRDGQQWTTYGDGQLHKDHAAEGRARLVQTASMAVEDVLAAYVEGDIRPELQLEILNRLPYELVDPATFFVDGLLIPSVSLPREAIEPVAAFRRPARVAWTVEAWGVRTRTLSESAESLSGLVVGSSVAFPLESFPVRAYAGLGLGRRGERSGVLLDLGYVLPVGRSFLGSVSHDLALGGNLQLGDGAPVSASSWHLGYRMDLELGKLFLRGAIGPAVVYPQPGMAIADGQLGWFFSIGAGYVAAVTNSGRI